MAYKKLNISKLTFDDEIISMEDALKNITPLDIPQDVIDNKQKMEVSNPILDYANKRVGVKIKYV